MSVTNLRVWRKENKTKGFPEWENLTVTRWEMQPMLPRFWIQRWCTQNGAVEAVYSSRMKYGKMGVEELITIFYK